MAAKMKMRMAASSLPELRTPPWPCRLRFYPIVANFLGSALVVESGTFAQRSRRKQASEQCLLPDHLAESSQPRLYRFRK
jgi:hypothetical protein